ncbi:MAG: tryptophan-rich sensory protein [Clostridia bacterium]|nr:tryptophan-rich sensory protein [Clostridia bacterium]
MSKFKIYIKSILIPVLVGGFVGVAINRFIDYDTLNRPPLSPPSITFPIIWTILYVLMGISYGILRINKQTSKEIDSIYYWQLIVNAFWSIFFFVFKWRLFSFLWIILLSYLVLKMISVFYNKNKTAGIIQIPYLVWTIFATYLNLGVYLLNK